MKIRFYDEIQSEAGISFDRYWQQGSTQLRYLSDLGLVYKLNEDAKWVAEDDWEAQGAGLGSPKFASDGKISFSVKYLERRSWRKGLAIEKKYSISKGLPNYLDLHGSLFIGLEQSQRGKVFLLEEDGHLDEIISDSRLDLSFIVDPLESKVFKLSGSEFLWVESVADFSAGLELLCKNGKPSFKSGAKDLDFAQVQLNDSSLMRLSIENKDKKISQIVRNEDFKDDLKYFDSYLQNFLEQLFFHHETMPCNIDFFITLAINAGYFSLAKAWVEIRMVNLNGFNPLFSNILEYIEKGLVPPLAFGALSQKDVTASNIFGTSEFMYTQKLT